jgi:AcrR family transcriptional regulator
VEPAHRREQILIHAANLFGSRGYHAVSISDIIQAAGIARGTFYLYFDNKHAIFEELLDRLVVRIKSCIKKVDLSAGAPSVEAQLVFNLASVLELLIKDRALLSILLEGAVGLDKGFARKLAEFYDQITDTIAGSLTLGQAMGLIRLCDTRIAALAAVGGLKEVLHDALRKDEEIENLEVVASAVLDIYMSGVLLSK